MSALAVVPTSVNDWRRPHTSAAPNVSAIFGQVLVARHRSSRLAAGRCARGVFPLRPPHRSLVSELVRPHEPAWKRKAAIQIGEPRGDVGVHAIPHDAAPLVLVEAEQQRQLEERARLRAAFRYRVGDAPGNRIRGARRVLFFVPEERTQVARRRETDPEHEGILHRVLKLVQQSRVETVLHANAGRVGLARKRRRRAIGKRPVGARNLHEAGLFHRSASDSDVAETRLALAVSSDAGGYGDG